MINQCFFLGGRHHIFQTNPGEQWAEGFVDADTVGLDMSPPFRAPVGSHILSLPTVSPVHLSSEWFLEFPWYIDISIYPQYSRMHPEPPMVCPKRMGGLKPLQKKNRANPNDFWNNMGPDNILFWGAFFLRDLTHTLICYFLHFVLGPLHFIMFF